MPKVEAIIQRNKQYMQSVKGTVLMSCLKLRKFFSLIPKGLIKLLKNEGKIVITMHIWE